jgi:NAD(P)-dependent dehydrogenase (short-subunit alcohol dehydrogenase family)
VKRWGGPEEVAQLAMHLASNDASYVTGGKHFINRGMLRNASSL